MASYFLCTVVISGGDYARPGKLVQDTDAIFPQLIKQGALLWPSSDPYVAGAANLTQQLSKKKGVIDLDLQTIMQAAIFRSLQASIAPVAPTDVKLFVGATNPRPFQAVYLSDPNTCDLATAADPTTMPSIGMVLSVSGNVAVVRFVGVILGFTGLTSGATYYLSPTPGGITTTAPTAIGQGVQRLGYAVSGTTLVLQVEREYEVL